MPVRLQTTTSGEVSQGEPSRQTRKDQQNLRMTLVLNIGLFWASFSASLRATEPLFEVKGEVRLE